MKARGYKSTETYDNPKDALAAGWHLIDKWERCGYAIESVHASWMDRYFGYRGEIGGYVVTVSVSKEIDDECS